MQIVNFIACAFLFGFTSWAILHENFKDGVLMKLGFILLCLNSLAGLIHYYYGHFAITQIIVMNVAFSCWAASVAWRRIHRPARLR